MFFNEFDNPPSLAKILTVLIIVGLFVLGFIFNDRAFFGFTGGLIIGAILHGWWRNKKPQTWPLKKMVGKLDNFLTDGEFREEFNERGWGISKEAVYESIRTKICAICGGNLEFSEKGNATKGGKLKGWSCLSCRFFYNAHF